MAWPQVLCLRCVQCVEMLQAFWCTSHPELMWRLTPVSPSSTHIHFVFLYVINHSSVFYQFEVMQISSIITSSPMIAWRSTAKTAKEADAAPESSRSLKWGILNHLNVRPYALSNLHVFTAYKWTNGPIEILTTMCLLGIEMQRTPKCLGQHMVQQNVAELQQLKCFDSRPSCTFGTGDIWSTFQKHFEE